MWFQPRLLQEQAAWPLWAHPQQEAAGQPEPPLLTAAALAAPGLQAALHPRPALAVQVAHWRGWHPQHLPQPALLLSQQVQQQGPRMRAHCQQQPCWLWTAAQAAQRRRRRQQRLQQLLRYPRACPCCAAAQAGAGVLRPVCAAFPCSRLRNRQLECSRHAGCKAAKLYKTKGVLSCHWAQPNPTVPKKG